MMTNERSEREKVSIEDINKFTNAYDILGVDPDDANDERIRRGYLRRSLLTHPDKNPDDCENATRAFQKVSSRLGVLTCG